MKQFYVTLSLQVEPSSGTCNDGRIIGRSINTTSDSDGLKFISQLIIQLDVNDTLECRTVKCVHDNLAQLFLIGERIINYTRDPPTPPENVHLSKVCTKNRLVFAWDLVQTTCPVVEYKVTAVNCGACPTATHNTSITCVVDDVRTVIDNFCVLSIQSVVCGVTGENRSNVTANLRVPGSPQLTSVLPHYYSASKELKKIEIQVMMNSLDMFSISEGIDGSVRTYTVNLTYLETNSKCGHIISNTVLLSPCGSNICNYSLEAFTSSCFDHSSHVILTAFGSNILGDGLLSRASNIETSNRFFHAFFNASINSFACQFIGNYSTSKSCKIKYGYINSFNQTCDTTINIHKFVNTHTETITVLIPPLPPTELGLCFVAVGKTTNLNIAVEGMFISKDSLDGSMNIGILPISLSLAVALILISIIFIIVIVLLARSRSRALRQLESLRESTHQGGNVTYEEINLPPVEIDTKENVAYGHVPTR